MNDIYIGLDNCPTLSEDMMQNLKTSSLYYQPSIIQFQFPNNQKQISFFKYVGQACQNWN